MDWNFITQRLAVGGAIDSPDDVVVLKGGGITHILNVRRLDDRPLIGDQFHYLHAPTEDNGLPKPAGWFDQATVFTLMALACPGNRILVHCAAGHSRAPSMLYGILLALGFSPGPAERLITHHHKKAFLTYKQSAEEAVKVLGYLSANEVWLD